MRATGFQRREQFVSKTARVDDELTRAIFKFFQKVKRSPSCTRRPLLALPGVNLRKLIDVKPVSGPPQLVWLKTLAASMRNSGLIRSPALNCLKSEKSR